MTGIYSLLANVTASGFLPLLVVLDKLWETSRQEVSSVKRKPGYDLFTVVLFC